MRGILIIAVMGASAWYFFGQSPSLKKDSSDLYRTFEKVQQDLQKSESNLNAYKERSEKLNSSQYRRAQEHLVKGLRDYRQGQFGRARDSFRLVLNLDSENTVAKRYYHLSAIRFDELVKFHMRQGMSYKDKNNFRLCKASYGNAMKMINNPNDSTYKEAEQFFRECDLAMTGRF
jgi:tetratricopeptide (TPR) repeat protein